MNKCPHPKCDALKPNKMYSCRKHWFQLPSKIRDKVWKGFREDASLWLEADKEAVEHWSKMNEVTSPRL